MTSASELFHSQRVRFGIRHNAVDDSGCASSPADASSSFSHHHRTTTATTNRRHHHHYSSQNNRRDRRHDLDGCDPPSRRIHRHRLALSEHEAVHPEQGGSQSLSGSIVNSEDFRSIRRQRATGNDRLPGAVLLARERLLERLRGVTVSGNRQSSRSSSSIHQDDLFNGNSSFIETENPPLEIGGDWPEEIASESWHETSRNHPPGLAQDALNYLPLEVFSSVDETSRECTICLEGFQDGDELIRLHCTHMFHSCCLVPWVQVCGACPNCRMVVFVAHDKPVL